MSDSKRGMIYMTYNEDFRKAGDKAIKEKYVAKAGRLATKDELMTLRNRRGDLIPKKVNITPENFVLMMPLSLGEIEEHFPGLVWGERVNMSMKVMLTVLANHIVLEGGDAVTAQDLLKIFEMDDISKILDAWFTMSGLKADEETMQKAKDMAKDMGITIGLDDDPKSKGSGGS